jgi:hypothetical protein
MCNCYHFRPRNIFISRTGKAVSAGFSVLLPGYFLLSSIVIYRPLQMIDKASAAAHRSQ